MKDQQNISRRPEEISFDPKELNRIGRNDKAFTLKMLKLFVDTATKCNKKMRSSVKKHKWEEIKAIAHKNIPTYCVMGLNELADFLKYIEHNALNKEKHRSIQERLKSLYAKNAEAINAVRKYIGLIRLENFNTETQGNYSYVT